MKVAIDGGGFGSDVVVCDVETALKVLELLPKLKPVKREYETMTGYKYTLQAKRTTDVIFVCINDDKVRLPEDLKELVGVMQAGEELSTEANQNGEKC